MHIRKQISFIILLLAICFIGLNSHKSLNAGSEKDFGKLITQLDKIFDGLENDKTNYGVVFNTSTGVEIYSRNKNTILIPASNEKLLTAGAAYKLLSPLFKFQTIMFNRGKIANGQLQGDLIVFGDGDPTISMRFSAKKDTREIFKNWATELKKKGIKLITGDIEFDASIFDKNYRHADWPSDQMLKWYCAPVSSFCLEDNCLVLKVAPGKNIGAKANVSILPKFSGIEIVNKVKTRKKGGNPLISFKFIENTKLEVAGTIPVASATYETFVACMEPNEYFAEVLTGTLREQGINIQGSIKISHENISLLGANVLLVHETPLLKALKVMNQRSQNFYAEQIFKKIGAFTSKKQGTFKTGQQAVAKFMKFLEIDNSKYKIADGSGLSKNNRVTTAAIMKILEYFPKELRDTLAVSGSSDGTMKRRFNSKTMNGRILAKTGTINKVDALSGYILDGKDNQHPFSIIVNSSSISHSAARDKMDKAVTAVFDYLN